MNEQENEEGLVFGGKSLSQLTFSVENERFIFILQEKKEDEEEEGELTQLSDDWVAPL